VNCAWPSIITSNRFLYTSQAHRWLSPFTPLLDIVLQCQKITAPLAEAGKNFSR
jgi:hypothetical protein